MSWQDYVDNQLLASQCVSKAAIAGLDGGVWAKSDNFEVSLRRRRWCNLLNSLGNIQKLFFFSTSPATIGRWSPPASRLSALLSVTFHFVSRHCTGAAFDELSRNDPTQNDCHLSPRFFQYQFADWVCLIFWYSDVLGHLRSNNASNVRWSHHHQFIEMLIQSTSIV